MFNKKTLAKISLQILLLGFLATTAFAINTEREGHRLIKNAGPVKISSQGSCKSVSSTGLLDIFIPTNSLNEWNAFLAHKPSFISFNDCTSVPSAPQNVSATAGMYQATVTFTAPTSDGGSPITTYTVTSNPGNIVTTGLGSPIVVYSLTKNISYNFSVTASNAYGVGPAALSNNVTPTATFRSLKYQMVTGINTCSPYLKAVKKGFNVNPGAVPSYTPSETVTSRYSYGGYYGNIQEATNATQVSINACSGSILRAPVNYVEQ